MRRAVYATVTTKDKGQEVEGQLRSMLREKRFTIAQNRYGGTKNDDDKTHITVASELLAVVSSGTTALLQVLLFCAWLNGRYPQHAKSLAPLIEELRVVQQQHNAPGAATRRGDFARLVLRLHELDGKLDGLCNDLKVLRQCVALAAWRRDRPSK